MNNTVSGMVGVCFVCLFVWLVVVVVDVGGGCLADSRLMNNYAFA